jgi:hypothetical protein
MSLQINQDTIDFDPEVTRWVNEYKRLKLVAAELADYCRL